MQEAKALQQGLGLFGSRKRKKAKNKIDAQIRSIQAQFNKEKAKLDALLRSKRVTITELNRVFSNQSRELRQLQYIQKQIINILKG